MLYMERSIASGPLEEQENQPGTPSAAPARNGADVMPLQEAAACGGINGSLPGTCAQMAFPYIPMQDMNPKRYDNREALQRGTLFPAGSPLPQGAEDPLPCRQPPPVRADGAGLRH